MSLEFDEKLVKKVLLEYSIRPTSIKPLPSGINYVYLIEEKGRKYVLKEYVKLKSPKLDDIHSKLIELMENGLPIPPIIMNSSKQYITKLNGRSFDLSKFIEHIDLSDQVHINDSDLILSSKTLARIQKKLNAPDVTKLLDKIDFKKKVTDTLKEIKKFKKNFETIKSNAKDKDAKKLEILKELIVRTDFYREKGTEEFTKFLNEGFIPTHGDYSMVNVLINTDRDIFIIDWDSLNLRPLIWDLQAAISLFSLKEIGNAYIMEPDYHKAELFLRSFLVESKLSKDQILLLPEVIKYNFAIYWLSYTLPAVNDYDFRLLFLVPDDIEKGLYWVNNLDKYRNFIEETIRN